MIIVFSSQVSPYTYLHPSLVLAPRPLDLLVILRLWSHRFDDSRSELSRSIQILVCGRDLDSDGHVLWETALSPFDLSGPRAALIAAVSVAESPDTAI